MKRIPGWLGIALIATGTLQGASQESSTSSPAVSSYRAVLNRYCVTCHNEKLKTAGLMLDKVDVDRPAAAAEVWEKVVRKLRTSAMPPAGMPRPDKATYNSFAAYLEAALDGAAAIRPDPGKPTVNRLNRAEYANAIRDLLSIEIDARSLLPADDAGYGFDNIGEALSVSPTLLERYMSAAEKISQLAIGDPAIRPFTETYEVPKFLTQEDRVSEDLPFATRGGMAVRHHFAADAEYLIRIRLRRNLNNAIFGLHEGLWEPRRLELRLDGKRIKVFSIGGERKGNKGKVEQTNKQTDSPYSEGAVLHYERNADAGFQVRLPVNAGTRLVGAAFLPTGEPEGILQPLPLADVIQASALYKDGEPAVQSITVVGPYEAKGLGQTASRQKIFVCSPAPNASSEAQEECAAKILSTIAHRAYRRPLTEQDVRDSLRLYAAGRRNGGFEAGIKTALEGILVSPKFLFRVEGEPAQVSGGVYPISDLDLASRLSFFLWSSIPDEELLDVAERGKLSHAEVLQQQVRRMLVDGRSRALVDNFGGQWLYLRNVEKVVPDVVQFPDFDDNLRQALQRETEYFLESQLREDRSVLELLTADYTYLNERLAKHYGMGNVYGSHFRRVLLPDERRRGLLGQGSLLTVTSYATRTSVVLRGKWLLENVLGTPPPPPPPDVPSLQEENGKGGAVRTMRQRMEQHRAKAACAVCHVRMDPLGFALENFDAIGKWRTKEGEQEIDVSGALPDGTQFAGPGELRKVLLREPEQFVTTLTEKLLTYALGRGVEYSDAPAVRQIVRQAAAREYRWTSLLEGIVKSVPFRMRRAAEEAGSARRR